MQTLQGTGLWEIAPGPVGIVIAGRAAGLRGFGAWFGLALVAIPILFFVWFVSVAYLGGLAGEPF